MITHDFTVSRETFAASRRGLMQDSIDRLEPHIAEALTRVGLPSWQLAVVDAALDVFDETARAEIDAWGPVIDDMRDLFAHQLGEALKNTKQVPAEQRAKQAATITAWVAAMAVNAGTEAATTSDPSTSVGLEWVTMHDGDVRSSHAEVDGQTVPTGHEFDVAGVKLAYPGQPVGDPSVWINCRCTVRPTMLTEASADTLTAAAIPDAGDEVVKDGFTTAIIAALPAADDPISAASSEADGAHATLLFLGDTANLDEAALKAALEEFITGGQVGIITEQVNGRAVLGKDAADVVLFDAANLVFIRNGLLTNSQVITDAYEAVDQFPTWLPHVTLGYPETPAAGEYANEAITFDRLALWFGESRTEYPLGEAMPEKQDQPAPEFAADAAPAPAPIKEDKPMPQGSDLRPWHGVLAPEAAPSGDRRGFAAKSLTTRDLPLPLKAQFIDDEGHKGSVVVGRIDEVYRDGGLIRSSGVWDNSPEADKAYAMIEGKMWRGVSVDLDAVDGEMVEAADGSGPSLELSEGRVCSATLCAIPAFAEAFVRNGTWADFANEPLPTGAKNPIPDWPNQQEEALTASAAVAPVSADYFRNPMLTEPTPVTLGEDGLVFGHLAEWGTCHIGYEVCTTAPHSETDYAFFLTGQVFTDAGPVAVGQLTVGGGHADGRLGVRAAMAHYDNVASAVADITVGEDEHGVWFSGRIRPWASEEDVFKMLAAGPSGDWRRVTARGRSSQELVAAHSVNVQGFPIPRTRFSVEHGEQTSLVAAGALPGNVKAARMLEAQRKIRRVEFNRITNKYTALKGL